MTGSLGRRSHRLQWGAVSPLSTPGSAPSASLPPRAAGRGVFIAFEGGDGAGKSTQVRLLTDWLRERSTPVTVTREPGGSPLGERIRELVLDAELAPVDPRTEALLFAASRSAHLERTVLPALRDGAVVVTDRYLDSSVAYQGAGRGLGAETVRELNLWAVQGLVPDLTVLLDVTEEAGRARRADRAADRMESEPADFHRAVRDAFLELARQEPQRYLVLDASAPVPEIAAAIRKRAAELLGAAA